MNVAAQESAFYEQRDLLDNFIDAKEMIEKGKSTAEIAQRLEMSIDQIELIRNRVEELN